MNERPAVPIELKRLADVSSRERMTTPHQVSLLSLETALDSDGQRLGFLRWNRLLAQALGTGRKAGGLTPSAML
jgi:hypothetical protein